MTPEPSQQGIATDSVFLSESDISYLRDLPDGEEAKLIMAILNGELVLGIGPKETLEELGVAPKINNHIDILYAAISEVFSEDKETRRNWIHYVSDNGGEIKIGGCFLKFEEGTLALYGESKKYGPLPEGVFIGDSDPSEFIYAMLLSFRANK